MDAVKNGLDLVDVMSASISSTASTASQVRWLSWLAATAIDLAADIMEEELSRQSNHA